MDAWVIPVTNGMLPRPDGGLITGVFTDPFALRTLGAAGAGGSVFICPVSLSSGELYPLGVLAEIRDLWREEVMVQNPPAKIAAWFVRLVGKARAKAQVFDPAGQLLIARINPIDLAELRGEGYPTICGAGWSPRGGYTETRSPREAVVTIYGHDFAGAEVALTGDLSGAAGPEQAHTIEHAIIRSLRVYGVCTPKTLPAMARQETAELKQSVALGLKWQVPELFGITAAGACGNPLTHLARFYLTQETVRKLARGREPWEALAGARRTTLSRLTQDLQIAPDAGLQVLQGLKRGMHHDDSEISEGAARRILSHFPLNPWS